MTTFWRRTGDNLKNGTILGGLFALGIIFGERIMNFLGNNFPKEWMFFGDWSVTICLVVTGLIIGYIIDRK